MEQSRGQWRRHAAYCPRGRADGVRRLDVFPDFAAFPVWAPQMARPELLGISADLAADLRGWQDWWERHATYGGGQPATPRQRRAWLERGEALARRLARQTGAAVVYCWPYGPDGGDPDCPHCGEAARRAR